MGRGALFALVIGAGTLPSSLEAQTGGADREAVMAPVTRLVEAMRAGDSAAVRAVFHPGAWLATVMVRQGMPTVQVDSVEAFIRAVGTPHEAVWHERLRNERIEVDGPLASVWTEYSFHAGDEFSHCGVNAFQLARTGAGWRIIALTDTRRKEGCPEGDRQ